MRIAVVDGYSSGRFLVQELLDRGAECVHVRSRPRPHPYFERSFRPGDYVADAGYEPELSTLVARLSELGVQRIVAGTEPGPELADRLAEAMGLPGNAIELVHARQSKHAMAAALAAGGLDAPRGAVVSSAGEAVAWFESSGLETVTVKPVFGAGSDRVRICQTTAEVAQRASAILSAPNHFGDLNGTLLIQEHLAGREYYSNTVSVDGVHVIVETWLYTKTRKPSGAPIFDFEEPADLDDPDVHRVHDYMRKALTALGIRNAAGHSEIMLTERGPVLLDPGARLGGGILPWVTAKFLGHSHAGVFAQSILHPASVLSMVDELPRPWERPIRYVSLINHRAGRARKTDWVKRIEALPTALAVFTGLVEGQELPETCDLFSSPGFVYLSGDSQRQIEADYQAIRAWETDDLYVTAP